MMLRKRRISYIETSSARDAAVAKDPMNETGALSVQSRFDVGSLTDL